MALHVVHRLVYVINKPAQGARRIPLQSVLDRPAERLILVRLHWPQAALTHLPARQTPALLCNLLFITKRQRRRLRKADNLVAFPSVYPHPPITIIQRPLCWKNKWNDCLLLYRRGEFCILCRIWTQTCHSEHASHHCQLHCANNDAWEGSN